MLDGLTFLGVGHVFFFFACGCLDGVTVAEDSHLSLKVEEAGLEFPTAVGLGSGLLSLAFNDVPSGNLIGEQPSKTSSSRSPKCYMI